MNKINKDNMNKIKKISIWLLALLVLPSTALAVVPTAPNPSQTFILYGTIQLDGSNAPLNTRVGVEKGGVEIANTLVTTVGNYMIENVTGISAGDTLTYTVSNTNSNTKTFTVPVNTLFQADLSFTTNTPAPAPSTGGGGGGGGGGGAVINDYTAPTETSISINDGAATTDSQQVTLSLGAKDVYAMMISNYPDFRDGFLENYRSERLWILSDGEGSKTVYVKYRDQYGNETEAINDTILYTTGSGEGEVLGVKIDAEDARAVQLVQIQLDAQSTYPGDVNAVLANTDLNRDETGEVVAKEKYTDKLIEGVEGLDQADIDAITYFILYGTVTTQDLGAGERAGVINSYKAAFGKLPTDYDSWLDVIKIANGRWPGETSESAEADAKDRFQTIYLREPNMEQPNDNAAVTIMAYGLRPDARNLDSEKVAILTFEKIFGYSPSSATDWDAVRAIAYSGAVR